MQSRQPLKRSRPTNKERDIVTAIHHFRQEKLLSAEYFLYNLVHHFHFLSNQLASFLLYAVRNRPSYINDGDESRKKTVWGIMTGRHDLLHVVDESTHMDGLTSFFRID
jgi:hypothetical protein